MMDMQHHISIVWSDFGHEAEMLFIAGFHPISISGLYSMIDNKNYDHWIQSMQIFQDGFITGNEAKSN